MKCGNCDKTDGLCYTSDPPKVKCTITGRFHGYDDECDAIKTIKITEADKATFHTHCIICDAPVKLTDEEVIRLEYGRDIYSKVCDKCKQAIIRIRKMIECDEILRHI